MEDSGEVEDRDELLTADLNYEIDSEADFFKIFLQLFKLIIFKK